MAREHVSTWLSGGPPGAADDDVLDNAALIASELAVNAIRHGLPTAALTLERSPDGIRISVKGTSPHGDPTLGAAGDTATSGRGLAIIAGLAEAWGWDREGDQLTVWAVL